MPGASAAADAVFGGREETLAQRHRRGQPLTAVQVESEIMRLCDELENRTYELAGRARLAAESEANHKAKWAFAFIGAEGTEARRKAEADAKCHEDYMKRKVEEGLYQSCKESLLSLRTQIDALRSISANIRAQT